MSINALETIGGEEEGWRRLNIATAIGSAPPPRRYIVGHLPEEPGTFGMLIGSDGSRKSWLALQIAVAVAGGRSVAGGLWPEADPGRVVYFSSEDSANELWRRLHAIGRLEGMEWVAGLEKNLDVIPLSAGTKGLTLACPSVGGNRFIEDPSVEGLIAFCADARLIIIDPLADAVEASENDDVAASVTVSALRRISRETGAGVLVVHHQTKTAMAGGDNGNQTARGSSKIPAAARWSVTLQPLADKEAAKRGIPDHERWTVVHEGKASYWAREPDAALYHWPEMVDDQGKTTDGVPLARELPSKGSNQSKPRRAASALQLAIGGEHDGEKW